MKTTSVFNHVAEVNQEIDSRDVSYFRNRFQREYNTEIIAHVNQHNRDRCRENGTLEEIPEAEAFRIVRSVGHLPHTKLYGIAPSGMMHCDRRPGAYTVIVRNQ